MSAPLLRKLSTLVKHRFLRISHGIAVEVIHKIKFLIPILLHATSNRYTILSYYNFFTRESQEEIRDY